ncbi:MAG TPA: AAA family ATPase [Acidimicrobiia bacterium]
MTWTPSPTPGGWQYRNDDAGATILVEQVTPIGRGVEAWVELRVDGVDVPVAQGIRNLMVPRAAQPFIDDAKAQNRKEPWGEGLRFAFHHSLQAWREDTVTVDLAAVEPEPFKWLVEPLIETGGHTRLIAAGGSGKSLFAEAVALTVTTGSPKFLGLGAEVTGPVMYLDWEANVSEHARRLRALCAGTGVSLPDRDLIFYRNESAPLAKVVRRVRDEVRRVGAVMVIVDSRQMAAGPSGQSSGEDTTIGLMGALREVGRPALLIDHKAKEDIQKGRRGGYGSVFNQNLARMEWEMTRLMEMGGGTRRFVLSLEKANNVGRLMPVAWELTTDGKQGLEYARFRLVSAEDVEIGSEEDLAGRVLSLFSTSTEPMPVARIAEMVGAKEASIRSMLNRDARFVNVNEGRKGKPGLWRPADDLLVAGRDDGVQEDLLGDEVF